MDQRPQFELLPGMTACCECGSVISTPTNRIPASFLVAHIGHTIATTLALISDVGEDQYVCAECHRVFDKTRSDDDALEDSRRKWGDIPEHERATVCDDCYRVLMARFN